MRHFGLAAGVLLLLVVGTVARAETVVLADGTRLQGKVSERKGHVTIQTADIILTLPADKVLRVEKPGALRPKGAPHPAPAVSPAKAPVAAPPQAAASSLKQALARTVDVSFEAAAPAEVFDYLQQLGNFNLVIDGNVRADTRAITLTLHKVSMATVLDVIRDMNDYNYEVRPGQILFVRLRPHAEDYVARVYDVRDLLVSSQDFGFGPGTGTAGVGTTGAGGLSTAGAASRGGGNLGGGLNPQYRVPSASGTSGGSTVTGAAPFGGMFVRSGNLALVITNSCGVGTWAQPAVVVP